MPLPPLFPFQQSTRWRTPADDINTVNVLNAVSGLQVDVQSKEPNA
jgi:hypothetical protein